MMKKVNWLYVLGGLIFLGLGAFLWMNYDPLMEAFGAKKDVEMFRGLMVFLVVIPLGGLGYLRIGFSYPHIKNYPLIFFLIGIILASGAVGYGYYKLPQVAGTAEVEKVLIPLVIIGLIAVVFLLINIITFQKELKIAKIEKAKLSEKNA